MNQKQLKIAPSILSADFGNLESEIRKICASKADLIHVDVMDGNFVPSITIGHDVIKQIKKFSTLKFDVHLMIEKPEDHYQKFIEAGADFLTFHIEACKDPKSLARNIRASGAIPGISIKPGTSLDAIKPFLDDADLILIMSVEPGAGGQKYMDSATDRIKILRDLVKRDTLISVDGGINLETGKIAAYAGADILVSGNFLFKSDNFLESVSDLKNL